MVIEHAALDILNIPENQFRDISDYVREYFRSISAGSEPPPDPRIAWWANCLLFCADTLTISNHCAVAAPPMLFEAILRGLILRLEARFPTAPMSGNITLFHSNWGYSHFPWHIVDGKLLWEEPTQARQQPRTRAFWNSMQRCGCGTIPELLAAMYAPMTDRQLYDAFGILDDLFFDPSQEVTPVDAYCFDNEGIPERESMVDFTYNCFLSCGWDKYTDIWAFFQGIQEAFREKDIPFPFPEAFREP